MDTNRNTIFGRIWAIARRELGIISSKPIYLFAMIGAPLFSFLFFLSLMFQGLPTDMPVAVVDLDRSDLSRNLTRQLDAFQQTEVVTVSDNFKDARILLQKGEIYGILLIPEGFSQQVNASRQPTLSYYTNNSFLIAGSLVFRDMKTISILASGAANMQVRLAHGEQNEYIMSQIQPIAINTHPIGNPWLNYSVYLSNILLPGILHLMIMLVTVYSIGTEIKRNEARKWLRMADNSLPIALTGKLLPQTIIFLIMGLTYNALLYKYMLFPLQNGIWPMFLSSFLFILSSQALGIFMIGMLPNVRLGLSFASLWGVISFSISGFTFPVLAMSPALQSLCQLFPLRHYFLIYVDQALNGYGMYYSMANYLAYFGFMLLPILVAKPLQRALIQSKYSL